MEEKFDQEKAVEIRTTQYIDWKIQDFISPESIKILRLIMGIDF